MALNLGFYLASWGMYRGSSFLVHKDYTVHEGAVRILASYSEDLRDLSFEKLGDDERRGRVLELALGLKEYYDGIAGEVAQGLRRRPGSTGTPRARRGPSTPLTRW